MIVRTFVDAPIVTLFGDIEARHLILPADAVGHTLIEARVKAGSSHVVEQAHLEWSDVQAYYCIAGSGSISVDGKTYPVKPGTLISLGTDSPVTLRADSDMRIAAIFCATGMRAAPLIVRELDQIHGTARDVFWGNGFSKRMLVRKDDMGFAFCVTVGHANTDSYLQYRNNLESCYYISGTGEYEWESGRHPILTENGQATVFIMNKSDTHNMRVKDESICLSIFTPPIEGTEAHDFSSGRPSSY